MPRMIIPKVERFHQPAENCSAQSEKSLWGGGGGGSSIFSLNVNGVLTGFSCIFIEENKDFHFM